MQAETVSADDVARRVRMMAATLEGGANGRAAGAFGGVAAAPPDPILGLNAAFRADTSPDKVNLGVGAYRTAENKPYVLPVVRRVEQDLAADLSANHEYLPQYGLARFCELAPQLLLGKESPAIVGNRVACVQALSGTGSLRVCFEFMKRFGPNKEDTIVYLPNPTWSNHRNIVPDAGLTYSEYSYFDKVTGAVDIGSVLRGLSTAPAGSVVLLHPCAHNPTGADPTMDQWKEILKVCVERKIIPLFDNAYQGFATGDLHEDAAAVRMFVEAGIDVLSCQSFAKNAGLYGERIGAFSVIGSPGMPVDAVKSQLSRIIRGLYSSPPLHGAAVMAAILGDPQKFDEWQQELTIMSGRIMLMRRKLKAALDENKCPGNWDRIINQIGMFSYTGLSKDQVTFMREEYHIYMTANGRMSMAGLIDGTVQYVADAMKDAILSVSA